MIDTSISRLSAISLYEDIADIYESLFNRFKFINIPILDVFTDYALSPASVKDLFEAFPVEVDLFTSSESFYSSFLFLHYYCGIVKYMIDNNIDFNSLTFKSEQLIVLHTFKLLKANT